MSEIKERPILFSAPMVRAILEGRKTVTRRPVKGVGLVWLDNFKPEYVADPDNNLCPYGKPGDRLWVRETFNQTNPGALDGVYYYRADGRFPKCIGGGRFTSAESWKPSIHMPRAASRILLEITDLRVERLQDISNEQALAEGVKSAEPDIDPDGNDYSPCELFGGLWTMINGMESWNANPWVWVVEFKRVTP